MKFLSSIFLFGNFVFLTCKAISQDISFSHPAKWEFQGSYIVSVSDADMLASAYVNGMLGPKEGKDTLSIIDLNKHPAAYKAVEVPASNSVAGPPAVLAIDKKNHYAYVIETFSPRPADNDLSHSFSDFKLGELLTVYDINNKAKPKLIDQHTIEKRPDSVSLSPDGKWLTVTYYPTGKEEHKPLAIYQMSNGNIEQSYFPSIPQWQATDRLIFSSWHPSGKYISIINETKAEVSFFEVNFDGLTLTQWGNTVSVGKAPFIGRFTQDGNHFLVNNLFWGPDVQGKWNEAPSGTLVNIKLNADEQKNKVRHALSSQVLVGPSPEGFAVSPKGDLVVTANMERSWLPYDDPRQSWHSSLSLIKRDAESGAMNVLHTTPYQGILPEAVVFDGSGKYLAVTTYDQYDQSITGGSIDFFEIVSDPLNPENKMIMQTIWRTPVTRGPHSMVLIE
jgi:DNA-binding beta-propeller fold protein YncE